MIVGYPMTAEAVDMINEAINSRIWEEMNSGEDGEDLGELQSADWRLCNADRHLSDVESQIKEAVAAVNGPEVFRIESLLNDVEELRTSISRELERIRKLQKECG